MIPTLHYDVLRRLAPLAACLGLLLLPACGLQAPVSRDTLNGGGGPATPAQNETATPSPAAPAAPGALDSAAMRAIEEADILKIVDGRAYALHQSKGLFIIDVSNPDAPAILGRLEFAANPVELYVVGSRAYVVLSSYSPYVYYGERGGSDVSVALPPAPPDYQPPTFDGSKVAVIDVSDPAAPKSMGNIRLDGFANASRRVGDVIYVVGTDLPNYGPLYAEGDALPSSPSGPQQGAFVASINVADPNNVLPVERRAFNGYELNLHVSETALFAASSDYNYGAGGRDAEAPSEPGTRVQYVDISDPTGKIAIRGSVLVPGLIRNRFYMDDHAGVLRIATESAGFGFQRVRLFTYDLSNPDAIAPLGQTEIIRNETLQAVRFDGVRGYVVTYLQRDPLFAIDLTDPAKPTVVGRLEVPGFSTHIEPRGDRLIAVGVDDQTSRRPAVVLYDVADPARPKQLSRIVLGPPGTFTESQALYDEKAFKIVEELGLIAMPFHYVQYDAQPGQESGGVAVPSTADFAPTPPQTPTCVSGVQLIDYAADALTQRGWFEHRGSVSRVGVIGTRAYAMSQVGFQTVNIDDRDHPKSVAFVPFLSEEESQYYGDCGYYGIPIDVPIIPPIDFIDVFSNVDVLRGLLAALGSLSGNGSCGTINALPGAMMMLGLGLMQRRRRRLRK